MLAIKNLTKTFPGKGGAFTAIEDINLTVEQGDIFGIIGMSGAGKSTLVRCINLLERPTLGTIVIDGVDVTTLDDRQLLALRRKIGVVSQAFNLLMQRTIIGNVALPLEIAGVGRDERMRRARALLEAVGLSEKEGQYPAQLSGGQQQRVSIARALAASPSLLLCDEPTSALDSLTTNSILKLLRDLGRQFQVTMVLITHEISVVEKICNKVAVMDSSVIVEQGLTSDVLQQPRMQITKQLLGRVSWDA